LSSWASNAAANKAALAAPATALGSLGIAEHIVRHAVGRDHASLEGDLEFLENLGRMFQGLPVGLGAHHDTHERLGHMIGLWRAPEMVP